MTGRQGRRSRRVGATALACLLAGLLAFAACNSAEAPAPSGRPPNIVLVIGDDHGFADFGFMGHPHVQTPHVDRLVESGTLFPLGYSTASVCRPALLSLLTGLQPIQWQRLAHRILLTQGGAAGALRRPIGSVQTLPRVLGEHGYVTFQGGKYFEGTYDEGGFSHGVTPPGTKRSRTGSYGEEGQHAIARKSMAPIYDFLDDHGDRPFFLWFAPLLPHTPFDAPERFRQLYAESGATSAQLEYWANISWFDDRLGDLLRELDERGLRESTLVVYVVDNGSAPLDLSDLDALRSKGSLAELGFRTPVVFSWPGRIPAGRSLDALVSLIDIYPTLLDYAGAPVPSGRTGESLRPLLEGRGEWSRAALIGDVRRRGKPGTRVPSFVRTERWHFIDDGKSSPQLFDVVADPNETEDVSASHPDLAGRFPQMVRSWQQQMKAEVDRLADERFPVPQR